MHGFIGEFFGTMVLILLGAGCCAGNSLNKTYGKQSGWWFICISWGLAVTMGVYVAGFLGSLGHLNPAVTIPFAIFGLFPWSNVIPYLLGQFLGAFVGAVLVIIQFYPQFKATPNEEEGNNVGIFTILVDPISSYDPFWTKISRRKERSIKRNLRAKGLFQGRYYEEKV